MLKLHRYYHTLRHLRPVQVYGRVWHRLYRPVVPDAPAPVRRTAAGKWIAPAERPASLLGPGTVRFLNVTREIVSPEDWSRLGPEKLWLLNLHYFDDLNAVGAWKRRDWHRSLIERWTRENPPGEGVGWQAYPTSLRIVNWIKWELAGNPLPDAALHSLATQARCLDRNVEWYLLGNHVIANAKALVFVGMFFEGAEAERWLERGLRYLERELAEEILPDGGHFERSPMYHSIILEDLLDLHNLAAVYPGALSDRRRGFARTWAETANRMRRWLMAMRHPDGEIAFFNDAACGIAPTPSRIEAYAERLGLPPVPEPSDGITHLRESGYVRLQRGPAVLLADVGEIGPDYIPGHAHADTLSFELSLHGARVLVNSGTSTYAAGPARQWERGTASHNTVSVDGCDSSEVWGSFRVARRARPRDVSVSNAGAEWIVSAAHDGYRHLPGRVLHRRTWRLTEDSLSVEDVLEGRTGDAVACFHLHPGIACGPADPEGTRRLTVADRRVDWSTDGAQLMDEPGRYSPEFGLSVPNVRLMARFLNGRARHFVAWERAGEGVRSADRRESLIVSGG